MSIIEVSNLVKRYDGRAVVDGVTFSVEEGEIFAILGRNGAGKTTTVESIAGLRTPDLGTIRVFGLDPVRDPGVKEHLGVQLQESRLPDRIEVWEVLDLYASFYPNPADWNDLIVRLGLDQVRETRYAKLSGGQKQRVSIALALVGNPRAVILDELTTGLDPQARRDTWELIEGLHAGGVTVILVTHFMEEAERLADRVAVIESGRLIALGSPADLVTDFGGGQQIRFRPSTAIEPAALAALSDVIGVEMNGGQVVVRGGGNALFSVVSHLATNQIAAEQLRVDQASLDDAFLALTGRSLSEPDEEV